MSRRLQRLLTWPAAFLIAGILLWYEQFKLTGNQGSVWLFTVLTDWVHLPGWERPFRLAVACSEIAASLLVLLPMTRVFGAALAVALMSGAFFFHIFSPLGIDPYGDGAVLFKQAWAVWLAGLFILLACRHDLRWPVRR